MNRVFNDSAFSDLLLPSLLLQSLVILKIPMIHSFLYRKNQFLSSYNAWCFKIIFNLIVNYKVFPKCIKYIPIIVYDNIYYQISHIYITYWKPSLLEGQQRRYRDLLLFGFGLNTVLVSVIRNRWGMSKELPSLVHGSVLAPSDYWISSQNLLDVAKTYTFLARYLIKLKGFLTSLENLSCSVRVYQTFHPMTRSALFCRL